MFESTQIKQDGDEVVNKNLLYNKSFQMCGLNAFPMNVNTGKLLGTR